MTNKNFVDCSVARSRWPPRVVGHGGAAGAGGRPGATVRPNILFIFDTSTSMLSDTGCPAGGHQRLCDGSPLCANQGQDSRLYRLKQAIRDT